MEINNKNAYAVNVRTLAEVYFEGGDLMADIRAIDRMQEGMKGHLMLQSSYPPEYRSEVPVRHECLVSGVLLVVQGRIDGLLLTDGYALVEEIKTTRMPVSSIQADDYPVHWAQAEIYAFILCKREGLAGADVRLVYVNLAGDKAQFTRHYDEKTLEKLFFEYACVYAGRISALEQWKDKSFPSMRSFSFPFSGYRPGQREMIKNAYIAFRDKKKLLVEAPTGIGKTAAALFPALRALGEGKAETIFYLTARTTGRKTAEDTLDKMRSGGLSVRSVTITAKKKACPMSEMRCGGACPYAVGYFDRQRDAIDESWGTEKLASEEIRFLSEKYRLCPFELSLALAETADVVICDYNYVFDPLVRLRRFFDRKGKYILLIDEAHNLSPRARSMYSARIGEKEIALLRRKVGNEIDRKAVLYKCLTELYRALPIAEEDGMLAEPDENLTEKIRDFMETAKEYLSQDYAFQPELTELFFSAGAMLRVKDEFQKETHRMLIEKEGKRSRVKLWCYDPAPRLKKAMKRMAGVVMFSATLAPIHHYAYVSGLDLNDGDGLLTLSSPFPKENLFCARLSIPTTYRMRDESAVRVSEAIYAMARSKTGNYLACFPSHQYMRKIQEIFSARFPDVRVILQERDMPEEDRKKYLDMFEESPDTPMVAFIAMGGVFSEGVDLPGEKLIGAAIVGVGLPQISFEGECMKALVDEAGEDGYRAAYVYPGIERCLQAAGRVIRTENDRGAVLFIDERYAREEYRRLLSPRYVPLPIKETALLGALTEFWEG